MTRISFLAVSLSLALLGCRDGSGDDTPGDDQPGQDGQVGADVTIQEVQNDAMAPGTPIELHGVVVVAIDTYGSRTGEIYIAEPEGGPFSGVKVYGASLTDVAMLQPGDLIDITGAEKHEACTQAAPCGSVIFENGAGLTEVQGDTQGSLVITKRGTATIPAPAIVDAKAIAAMPEAQQLAEWEKWEGVLINVQNARQLDELRAFDDGDDQKQFNATGGIRVQTSLTAFDASAVANVCYSGIVGLGDFFFDYLVLPRTAADMTTGGTGCEALPVAQAATIPEIQAGTKTGLVTLTDVYVSAVSGNGKNLWVSTSLTASANNGIYIFRCSSVAQCNNTMALPTGTVPGAKVTITGTVAEFNNDANGTTLTQLTTPTITVTAAPAGLVAPAEGQTAATLLADATGEPYEGVLVKLTNVKITSMIPMTGMGAPFGVVDMANFPANTAFKSDDDIMLLPQSEDAKCYASITGIWTYQVYDNRYQFLPIAVGTGTGTCQ